MADFADIRAFVEVADQGSFTRAATHLFISQPALSRRVGRLARQYMLKRPNLYLSNSAYSAGTCTLAWSGSWRRGAAGGG